MAKSKNEEKKNSITTKLLSKMTFAPESREAEGKPEEIQGRIRYFFSLFRAKSGAMMLPNVLFTITMLPLLAVLLFSSDSVYGMEKISYFLQSIADKPYYMQHVGVGISSGATLNVGRQWILQAYQYLFLIIGAGIALMGIGAGGLFRVAAKLVWKDTFVCKKDSYGNQVPQLVKEFFIGLKKYWLQTLVVFAFAGVFVAAAGNAFVYFVMKFQMGQAGAGEWILVILTSIVSLIFAMFFINLVPMVVMYDIPFLKKLKNAFILSISMPIANIFMLIVIAVPILLATLISGFIGILIIAVIVVFGGIFYSLMWCNYLHYYADAIITPLYEETQKTEIRKQRKAENKNKKQKAKIVYKKK